jgi:hypothetical protein
MEALKNDAPVAFLNLHAGDVEELDTWHWVTIIGVDEELGDLGGHGAGTASFKARFYDHGQCREADVGRWLATTKTGGGFVFISNPQARQA